VQNNQHTQHVFCPQAAHELAERLSTQQIKHKVIENDKSKLIQTNASEHHLRVFAGSCRVGAGEGRPQSVPADDDGRRGGNTARVGAYKVTTVNDNRGVSSV
jgi:hypothetical protein